jgi:uncharacterized protein
MAPQSTSLISGAQAVNWLLNNFLDSCVGVEQALAVSADGLLMAMSSTLDRDDADRLAAVITGLQALSESGASLTGKGRPNRVLVDMDGGFLIVATISAAASIGVLTYSDCDLGAIGYQMTLLSERFGEQLTPELITHLKMTMQ